MAYFVTGVAALGVLILLGQAFVSADPRALARTLRYIVGIGLILFGALLVFAERFGLGTILIAMGISAISAGRLGPIDLGGGRRSAGTASTVRSHHFEMRLDHDSGKMNGRIIAGSQSGRELDDLNDATLMALRDEVAGDGESLALLEAYLDRRIPNWREHVEADPAAGPGGAADSGPMTDQQAYEILGLAPGASKAEIRAAHRRLMMRMHPDQGGSTYLAAKINQAKDRLLGGHR